MLRRKISSTIWSPFFHHLPFFRFLSATLIQVREKARDAEVYLPTFVFARERERCNKTLRLNVLKSKADHTTAHPIDVYQLTILREHEFKSQRQILVWSLYWWLISPKINKRPILLIVYNFVQHWAFNTWVVIALRILFLRHLLFSLALKRCGTLLSHLSYWLKPHSHRAYHMA